MENIKIISRRTALMPEFENLAEKEKQLEKQQKELQMKVEEITKQCNHSIVVKFESECPIRHTKVNTEVCLFCYCRDPYYRRYMSSDLCRKQESTCYIEKEDYSFLNKSDEKVLVILEQIYVKIREKFPKDTEEEIFEKVKEELKTLKLKKE